jgi:hypothetical protein
MKRHKAATLQELEDALKVTVPIGVPVTAPATKDRRRKFLAGPLDWGEICLVTKLDGSALAVWLLIHLRKRLATDRWISLPNRLLVEMGISRFAKSRALRLLQQEGLIRVAPTERGKTTLVALAREDRAR